MHLKLKNIIPDEKNHKLREWWICEDYSHVQLCHFHVELNRNIIFYRYYKYFNCSSIFYIFIIVHYSTNKAHKIYDLKSCCNVGNLILYFRELHDKVLQKIEEIIHTYKNRYRPDLFTNIFLSKLIHI